MSFSLLEILAVRGSYHFCPITIIMVMRFHLYFYWLCFEAHSRLQYLYNLQLTCSQSYSDTFLAHFLSFSATPTYHTLPQKIQDGMPLFHLPPNQSKPVCPPPFGSDLNSQNLSSPGSCRQPLFVWRQVSFFDQLLLSRSLNFQL